MQSYVESSDVNGQAMLENQTEPVFSRVHAWKPADDSDLDMMLEQAASGCLVTLSADETRELEEMSASRVKIQKPEPLTQYRKPKNELFDGMPAFGTAFKQGIIGAMAVGLVVAFFTGMSGTKSNEPAHISKSPEPAHVKTASPRRVARVSPSATTYHAVAAAVSQSAALKNAPVVVEGPTLEYKGPSSVTGLAVSHRRAYQAATLATQSDR